MRSLRVNARGAERLSLVVARSEGARSIVGGRGGPCRPLDLLLLSPHTLRFCDTPEIGDWTDQSTLFRGCTSGGGGGGGGGGGSCEEFLSESPLGRAL